MEEGSGAAAPQTDDAATHSAATAEVARPAGESISELTLGRPLFSIASQVVPVLKEMAELRWPAEPWVERRWKLPFGGFETVERQGPARYRIILRRRDLATLQLDWRLEANGPLKLLDWSDSGSVYGSYGFSYETYTVRPVFDEIPYLCGFGINGRFLRSGELAMRPLDARVDCSVYVSSVDVGAVIAALRRVEGHPRIEERHPGYSPTAALFDLLQRINKREYFMSFGVDSYLSPGWTVETIEQAFSDPKIRAVRLGT